MIAVVFSRATRQKGECYWPDPEKVDELKVEFCPIIRSRTNERSRFSEEQIIAVLKEAEAFAWLRAQLGGKLESVIGSGMGV
jgi:hypothetical protein